MEKIYQSKYVSHIYYLDQQILEAIWTEGGLMNDDEYRQESLNFIQAARNHRPKAGLIDTRDFQFTIVPETQEWLNTVIFPELIKAGIRKMAFLVTDDLFSQVSIEQAMDEKTAKEGFQTRFFDDYESAKAWVLE